MYSILSSSYYRRHIYIYSMIQQSVQQQYSLLLSMISCSQCTTRDRDNVWQRVTSHAECSCHAASLMLQTPQCGSCSGNFAFGKALALQGHLMTRAVKDKRQIQTEDKRKMMSLAGVSINPKSSLPRNKHTLGCPVCEKNTASMTAGQVTAAYPVWVTPKVMWPICCLARQDLIQGVTQKWTHLTR